jgi:hypothetical protein
VLPAQISRAELDAVKKTITDAETGKASLVDLARAHEICSRAGASKTLGIISEHIHRMTPGRYRSLVPNVGAGIVSGAIVSLTIGRLGIGRLG